MYLFDFYIYTNKRIAYIYPIQPLNLIYGIN